MTSYRTNPPTEKELDKWIEEPSVNPRTKRKIKQGAITYKLLDKYFQKRQRDRQGDNLDPDKQYLDFRNHKMDPFLFIELDPNQSFQFPDRWNPYTGERLQQDSNGPLYFDPVTLVRYFYTNRLNHLWVNTQNTENGEIIPAHYDHDGLANGPNFYISSRGSHPDWYLFRLPILDCYLRKDHMDQSVTMGPKLTDQEIKKIDDLAQLNKQEYENTYHRPLPSLQTIKEFYEMAIDPCPYLPGVPPELEPFVDPEDLSRMRRQVNTQAVEYLKMI